MMEWNNDMEAAPKDGTEIIGIFFREYDFQDKPTIYGPWTVKFDRGAWWASHDGMMVVEYMSDFRTEYKQAEMDPTHWMPLPTPPYPLSRPSHDRPIHR